MPVLVNVCGESDSGTTLLVLMLGSGPRAFACGEVAYRYRPITRDHLNLVCGCGAEPCPVWSGLHDLPAHRFHGEVCRRLDVDVVADSSKRLSWVVDTHRWGPAEGLSVANVVIWKSPLEHLYSHWKRGRPLETALDRFQRYYGRLLTLGLPVITVEYDRLVSQPATMLQQVCARLGIDYFPGKECFANWQPHLLFGNRGTWRRMAESGVEPAPTEWPTEFLAAVEPLSDAIDSPALQRLCAQLQNPTVDQSCSAGDVPAPRRQLWPWWYYCQRLDDVWRGLCRNYRPANRRAA